MTKKIFHTIILVTFAVFLSSILLFMSVLYDYFTSIQQNQLRIQIDLASEGVESNGIEYLERLKIDNCRITWIGSDGSVLYDSISDVNDMENHFEREEVKEALAEGYGKSSRYSSTLTERYLYSAKRMSDGTVIRISITQSSLLVLMLGMLHPIIVIIVIAVILSIVLASRLSKRIVKPLNELNLGEPLKNDEYEELLPLLRRIDVQQKEIRQQKWELKQKQNEFEVLTSSMVEGIVLLNHKGIICSINKAAMRLFNADVFCIGKDMMLINRSIELTDIVNRANSGQHAETIMNLGNRKYQVNASPIMVNDTVSGIVLLLLDITEKEKTEQMRREFTANVSHELKTPLHTISGCAELLSNLMVKPEDVQGFSKQIYMEAQRMIQLIEDIIKLSRLDEGASDMHCEETDLYILADNVVKTLAQEAEISGIKINLCGESAVLCGIPQLLESIVYNLCDNAIKYNRKNGLVTVAVKNEDKFVNLSVSDTGIGIPEEHIERIFERFYRVDKSHSKEIGGTGLGLSIVKHAAKLHNAEIDVRSVLGKGTTVTVKFPKDK